MPIPALLRAAAVSFMVLALLSAPVTAADDEAVGTVSRIKGTAVAMQDALPRVLKAGDSVLAGDVLSTGKGARLEIKMVDKGVMTLGEKTIFVVMEYLARGPEPNAAMRLLEGAFSAVSGEMMQTADASFTVETETATIGIRGTSFWGGAIDGAFGIALLEGKGIIVENKAGRVILDTPGEGTTLHAADVVPGTPKTWSGDKIARAVATVAF